MISCEQNVKFKNIAGDGILQNLSGITVGLYELSRPQWRSGQKESSALHWLARSKYYSYYYTTSVWMKRDINIDNFQIFTKSMGFIHMPPVQAYVERNDALIV